MLLTRISISVNTYGTYSSSLSQLIIQIGLLQLQHTCKIISSRFMPILNNLSSPNTKLYLTFQVGKQESILRSVVSCPPHKTDHIIRQFCLFNLARSLSNFPATISSLGQTFSFEFQTFNSFLTHLHISVYSQFFCELSRQLIFLVFTSINFKLI